MVVLKIHPIRFKRRIQWKCKCDCGNLKVVIGNRLISKHTTSCGCLKQEMLRKRNSKDIAGHRFGRLTVHNSCGYKDGHQIWNCQCDCGESIKVNTNSLSMGNTKSCGCLRMDVVRQRAIHNRQRFVGEKFGRLCVLERDGSNRRGNSIWKCQCDCGNVILVDGSNLRSSNSISCGCFQKDMVRMASQDDKRNSKIRMSHQILSMKNKGELKSY
jgi:hypothetical protein